MKHLTILSLSASVILFTGAHFQNHFNNVCGNTDKIQQAISFQVNETKATTDSLIISTGTATTLKAAKKAEHSTIKIIGNLVQSVF